MSENPEFDSAVDGETPDTERPPPDLSVAPQPPPAVKVMQVGTVLLENGEKLTLDTRPEWHPELPEVKAPSPAEGWTAGARPWEGPILELKTNPEPPKPCGDEARAIDGSPLMCALPAGHSGWHSDGAPMYAWFWTSAENMSDLRKKAAEMRSVLEPCGCDESKALRAALKAERVSGMQAVERIRELERNLHAMAASEKHQRTSANYWFNESVRRLEALSHGSPEGAENGPPAPTPSDPSTRARAFLIARLSELGGLALASLVAVAVRAEALADRWLE